MPKATRVSLSIPHLPFHEKSEGHPLVLIVLLCGVGLLVSLVAILIGVQLAWYLLAVLFAGHDLAERVPRLIARETLHTFRTMPG